MNQTDWQVRRVLLVFACALFSWAVGSLLGQYISVLYKWSFPLWLYGLLLLFAVEACITPPMCFLPGHRFRGVIRLGLMWLYYDYSPG